MKEKNIKRILKVAYNESDFVDFDFSDYNYIIKATDNFMSGWGVAEGTKAKSIVFCKNMNEVRHAIDKMENDSFVYCNWYNIKMEKPQFKTENVFTIRIIDHCVNWRLEK